MYQLASSSEHWASPALGLQAFAAVPSFPCRCWGSGLRSSSYKASVFVTEPSSQPQESLLIGKKSVGDSGNCLFSGSVLKEFEQAPSHLTDECHLFSMEDLLRTKKGLLAPLLKDILKSSLAHVASCEVRDHLGQVPFLVPGSREGDASHLTLDHI